MYIATLYIVVPNYGSIQFTCIVSYMEAAPLSQESRLYPSVALWWDQPSTDQGVHAESPVDIYFISSSIIEYARLSTYFFSIIQSSEIGYQSFLPLLRYKSLKIGEGSSCIGKCPIDHIYIVPPKATLATTSLGLPLVLLFWYFSNGRYFLISLQSYTAAMLQ